MKYSIPTFPKRSVSTVVTCDYRLSSAEIYISRSGQSVAVILKAADDPRYPHQPVLESRRVYLSNDDARYAGKPDHLVNIAMHKSRAWLDTVSAKLWYAQCVVACRPLREKCKPLLQAISHVARNKFGHEYWRTHGGRELLSNELRLAGVRVPPFGSINNFLPLKTAQEAV